MFPAFIGGVEPAEVFARRTEYGMTHRFAGFTSRPNSGHVKESSVFTSRCRLRCVAARSSPALHYAYLAAAL
jgi:hypothetical protein